MYRKFIAERRRRGIANSQIAQLINSHENTVINKVQGHSPLSLEEAKIIHHKYFADMDFLELFEYEN